MDARDSSSSPSSAAWDGPVEEDGLPAVREGLAKEAAHLFQSRRFSDCVDVLNQLRQKGGKDDDKDDLKVRHNIAVAEFFRNGCSDPRKLLPELNEVKIKSEYLARTSGEHIEVASSRGSNGATLLQLYPANTGSLAFADEFDTSIVTFNIAVILYHLREYKSALSVLWSLYQNIDPIDEAIALHICLLLLDIAIVSQDASKAEDVIQYLEKSFGGGYLMKQGDNGSIAQQQSLNGGLKISAATSNIAAQDASSSDSSSGANVSENSLVGSLSDDALEYESLYTTLDSGGQNLGRPALNDLSKTPADRVMPAIDLKRELHLYKVRFLLFTRNQKAAKREIKLAINDLRGRDPSTELLLKSQLEYSRGNHNKAVKILLASDSRAEAPMQIIFDNNFGCIYHGLGNHNLSNYYFSKALKTSSSLLSEKPRKLQIFSQDKSRLIVYNCGLQALVCGNPLPAAHYFEKATPTFEDRPLFWLRYTEICLLALKKDLLRLSGASSSGEEIVKLHVVGSGRSRQLVVDDADLKNQYYNSSALGSSSISLPFARQCLLKALVLLDSFELRAVKNGASVDASEDSQATSLFIKKSTNKNSSSGDSKTSNPTSASTATSSTDDPKETKGVVTSNTTLRSSITAYGDMCRKENHMVKQAVLADLAYVQLCLSEPLRALSAARLLQQLPNCSRMYIFLARVYAAEALCHLDRLQEAEEQLSVYVTDGNNVELPYSNEVREKWSMAEVGDGEESNGSIAATKTTAKDPQDWASSLKPEEARGALCANLASMFAVKGDFEQADRLAREALSSLPDNPRATLTAVYVDLRQGKAHDALVKLRRSRHVWFLSTDVTLSNG